MIVDPRGEIVITYYWSIGVASNNQVEAYATYQGIHLDNLHNIHKLTIIGDSLNTIRDIKLNHLPLDLCI